MSRTNQRRMTAVTGHWSQRHSSGLVSCNQSTETGGCSLLAVWVSFSCLILRRSVWLCIEMIETMCVPHKVSVVPQALRAASTMDELAARSW